MVLGEYKHNLDTKGRIAIPAKFRLDLNVGAIITRGLDRSLFIFGMKEWEVLIQKLIALPLAQANSRAFVRLMLSGASDVELDAQGRILIPEYLEGFSHPNFLIFLRKEILELMKYQISLLKKKLIKNLMN